MRKKRVRGELISISEAAVILGIAKDTFYKRFRKGEYDAIFIEKRRSGWKVDMIHVFHFGYPGISEDNLILLIYKYRADRIERRKKNRRRKK